MQLNGNAPSLGRNLLTESTQIYVNWLNSMTDLGFSRPSTGKQSGVNERLDDAPSYACYDTQMLCETCSIVFCTAIGGICWDTWRHWMNDITRQVQRRTANGGRYCLPMCFHRLVAGYVLNHLHCMNEWKQWVELTRGESESGYTHAGAMD